MANVLLTNRCNLRCAYCFAQERLEGNRNQVMTLADVATVIAFLKRSDHPILRAMGGEPTLHPEFPRIVEMALAEGMRVDVLSNATWPAEYNDFFRRISPRRLLFLLNIDHPDNYAPSQWERIERNTAAVAARGTVTLSFNLFEEQPRYEYLLDLIRRHRIDKVRMSFSLPVLGARNACLTLEQCKTLGPAVVELVRRAGALGAEVRMDNAVPLCVFSYEQVGELLMTGALDLKRNARCEPIVDIGPDLSVWCCFCLSRLWNRRLDEFENLQEIQTYYRQAMGLYQGRLYPMDACDDCKYRDLWGCQGGCLSYAALRHGELAMPEAAAPVHAEGWRPDAVLALSEDVEIERYDVPKRSYALFNRRSGLEMEVDGSYGSLLELLNGRHSAEDIVARFSDGDGGSSDGPVAEFAQRAMRKGACNLLESLIHERFVV
jgi:MoaA/NifB/PqqE/SkfB family radical SAM enzyme